MRKSVPRSSRQLDLTEASWPSERDANLNGMDMSPVHQVQPRPSSKAEWKEEEDKADRRRGGKTTIGNGQAWSLPSPIGQWGTEKNGGNWLWSHLVICGAPTTHTVKGQVKMISTGIFEDGCGAWSHASLGFPCCFLLFVVCFMNLRAVAYAVSLLEAIQQKHMWLLPLFHNALLMLYFHEGSVFRESQSCQSSVIHWLAIHPSHFWWCAKKPCDWTREGIVDKLLVQLFYV